MTAQPPSTEKKLDEVYRLIEDCQIAVLTTRRPDGHLVSRPMATQKRITGVDLWFVTDRSSHKCEELESDNHVNISYTLSGGTRGWVSISGFAKFVDDRRRIHELYRPDWKAWFGDMGDARNGSPDDPRIGLIYVDAQTVTYMTPELSRPRLLFEVMKGMVTGETPPAGTVKHISRSELEGQGGVRAGGE